MMRHETGFLAAQRVRARGELGVAVKAGRTRLARLFQEGGARIRMPATARDPLEAVLINTAGGLTGGDRLDWTVDIEDGASAVVTTQACEKAYRASEGLAEVGCRMSVAQGGWLAWLPQETILFDGCAFRRTIEVDLAANARALIVEATVFGRQAMGERVTRASVKDRWRIRRDGRLIHAEDFAAGPEIDRMLGAPAGLGGATAIATVLYLSEDAEWRLDSARGIIGQAGGASFWRVGGSGKLLARIVADDGYSLRRRLVPLIGLLNGQAGLPKVWTL